MIFKLEHLILFSKLIYFYQVLLNDLFINLYANRIEADGAITLAGGIYHQRQAARFGIELFFNNITAKGTESLTGAIA